MHQPPFTFGIMADTSNYYVARRDGSVDVIVKDKDTGDADTPLMTLTGDSTVVEGSPATYMVTASVTPSTTKTVMVKVENVTGSFLAVGEEKTHEVMVSSTTPVDLEIDTVADMPDGNDGAIKATIVDGVGYALGETITVSTDVTDPAVSLGTLTLASINAQTFLDGEILFTVEIDPAPDNSSNDSN